MSFDLLVWHEPAPITADAALAKLDRWARDEPGIFAPHPAVPRMREALLERFPPLESLDDATVDLLGVWSVTPEPSDSLLVLSCVWPKADEVAKAVAALASDHGLVCYEPGYHILSPNAPGYVPRFTLKSMALPTAPDPDGQRLEWTVHKLGDDNFFAILERADGWFAQVGYGENVRVPAGTYALEYRENSADRHFRTETRDVAEAARFLREFLDGQDQWKRRHAWRSLMR